MFEHVLGDNSVDCCEGISISAIVTPKVASCSRVWAIWCSNLVTTIRRTSANMWLPMELTEFIIPNKLNEFNFNGTQAFVPYVINSNRFLS